MAGARSESNREFRRIGGTELPWSVTSRTTVENHIEASRMQFQKMSQTEREKLKHEVEQIVRKGPVEPNQAFGRWLLAIVIIVPVGGISLLCLARNHVCANDPMSETI